MVVGTRRIEPDFKRGAAAPLLVRVRRFLRNPRYAAGLLLFLGIWMAAGALGLRAAFSHPVFLAVLLWVAASASVCAWERTARTLATWRAPRTPGASLVARLRVAEPLPLLPAEESDPDRALQRAEAALRRLGLRAHVGPESVTASSGVWSLVASPLFHWMLVALLVLIPVGRLSRSEGTMRIVEGSSLPDVAESYSAVDEGPLNTAFTGLAIGVEPAMEQAYREGDVDRGAAPTVTVSAADGTVRARQRVYPNHALRHGSLMIHMEDFGPGVLYSIENSAGASLQGHATMDLTDEARQQAAPYTIAYFDDAGSTILTLTISAVKRDPTSDAPRQVSVRAEQPGASTVETLAAQGDSIDLGGGRMLRLQHLGFFARLSVVDDWSVPWMYALFALAMGATTVSALVPYRVVHVLLDTRDAPPVMRFTARHSWGLPDFTERVRRVLIAEEN